MALSTLLVFTGVTLVALVAMAAPGPSAMLGFAVVGARAVRLLRRQAVVWLGRSCGGGLLAVAGLLAFYRRSST